MNPVENEVEKLCCEIEQALKMPRCKEVRSLQRIIRRCMEQRDIEVLADSGDGADEQEGLRLKIAYFNASLLAAAEEVGK